MGLRRGFWTNLTAKRARLEYAYLESPEAADLLRCADAGPPMEAQPTAKRTRSNRRSTTYGRSGRRRRARGRHRRGAGAAELVDRAASAGARLPLVLVGVGGGRRAYERERRVSRQRRRAEYLSRDVLQGASPPPSGRCSATRATCDAGGSPYTKGWFAWRCGGTCGFGFASRAGGVAIAGFIVAILAFLRPLQAESTYVAAVMALLQAERVMAQELIRITSRLSHHREFFVGLTAPAALPETARAY